MPKGKRRKQAQELRRLVEKEDVFWWLCKQIETVTLAALEINNSESDPETIMDVILALDDLHKDGKLPQDAYIQRRTELKAKLQAALEERTD